jgi:HAD superfamily hydrolase (TIGR01549 family)
MSAPRGLLLDLDDTLYDYVPCERRGRAAVLRAIASDTGRPEAELKGAYDHARKAVKARLGERGSAHSRLLYLLEVAQHVGALSAVRRWERTFWTAYLDGAALREGARELLVGWRRAGHKVAIVTDLVAEVQLWKLEQLGLFPLIDALVVSEEVALDKPAPEAFELAIQRLGVTREGCVVVGDSAKKDGGGAARLGLPFYQVRGTEPDAGGMTLLEVASALGVST